MKWECHQSSEALGWCAQSFKCCRIHYTRCFHACCVNWFHSQLAQAVRWIWSKVVKLNNNIGTRNAGRSDEQKHKFNAGSSLNQNSFKPTIAMTTASYLHLVYFIYECLQVINCVHRLPYSAPQNIQTTMNGKTFVWLCLSGMKISGNK